MLYSILIVDDNVYDREGVKDLVNWGDLNISVVGMASNGEEGIQKALMLKPDFILTDVAMPLMNGIQMTRRIKEHLPNTRFIFMSCFDEFDFIKNAINLDVCAYILKPVDLYELTEAIKKVIQLKEEETRKDCLIEELRQEVQSNLPVLREQFLRDLLHGSIYNTHALEDRAVYLGINYLHTFLIVLIQIDNYDLLYSDIPAEQRYLMIYQIRDYVGQTILKKQNGYLLILDTNNLCIIISNNWLKKEEAIEEILDACSLCRNMINEKLDVKVTLGISNFSEKFSELPLLFTSAEYAIKSKFFSEGNRIIMASEVKLPESCYNYNFGDLKKEIAILLEKGGRDDILEMLERYCGTKTCQSEVFVKSLYFLILNAIQIILVERNESLNKIFDDETIIWEKLSKFETILDIRQWMVNILLAVKDYLDNLQSKRYQSIVEDMKKIIEKNYSAIQNVEQVVEPIYISASYGNHIFKQETGMTIFDYLIKVRIEKAKQMLEDPYCRIYEISESVGYVSKSYFSSIFKDYTGVTPKQYRDKYCK